MRAVVLDGRFGTVWLKLEAVWVFADGGDARKKNKPVFQIYERILTRLSQAQLAHKRFQGSACMLRSAPLRRRAVRSSQHICADRPLHLIRLRPGYPI
jgi:hypothetical protein